MTVHQTNVSGLTHMSLAGFFEIPSERDLQPPRRYTVMVYKADDPPGNPLMGYVVTHLSIWDWCELNRYWLVKLYRDATRDARANERTDLF